MIYVQNLCAVEMAWDCYFISLLRIPWPNPWGGNKNQRGAVDQSERIT